MNFILPLLRRRARSRSRRYAYSGLASRVRSALTVGAIASRVVNGDRHLRLFSRSKTKLGWTVSTTKSMGSRFIHYWVTSITASRYNHD
jgi:hypothetical protein